MSGKIKIGGAFAVAAVLLLAYGAQGASVLHKKNGQAIDAKSIRWRALTKEYQVDFGDGSVVPVALADVESVEVDKPADLDKAEALMASKSYEAAIPLLDGVATQYAMLQWDTTARELLARAYCAKGDFKKAVQVLEDYFTVVPKDQAPDAFRDMYWIALLGAQRGATLKTDVEDAIKGGSKTLAPLAVLRRADLAKSESRREDAFLDYMRVALLYNAAKDVQPEALFKAAQVLDATNDRRADELRKRLATQFPGSPYARPSGGGF